MAAAWRDVDAVRDEGEGVWVRKAEASVILGDRFIAKGGGMDREGGRELRSGAIGMRVGCL